MSSFKGILVSEGNPFKHDIEKMLGQMRKYTRRNNVFMGTRKLTIVEKVDYYPGIFVRVYQNKEKLLGLSGDACRVLMYIMCTLGFEEQMIRITPEDVAMDRRKLSKVLLELMLNRVLLKKQGKWHYYWVNLTLIISGNFRDAGKVEDKLEDEDGS